MSIKKVKPQEMQYIVLNHDEVITTGTLGQVIEELTDMLEDGADAEDVENYEVYELGKKLEITATAPQDAEIFIN